jgi:hypothetical protein
VVIIHNAVTGDDPHCDSAFCILEVLSILLSGVGAIAIAHGLELLFIGIQTEVYIWLSLSRKQIQCFRNVVFTSSTVKKTPGWWDINFLGRYTLDVWVPGDGEESPLRGSSNSHQQETTVMPLLTLLAHSSLITHSSTLSLALHPPILFCLFILFFRFVISNPSSISFLPSPLFLI